MKITTRQVLQYFLQKLCDSSEPLVLTELDPYFEDFLIQEELSDILKWTFKDNPEMYHQIDGFENEDILEVLNNLHLIRYYYHKWEQEIKLVSSITVDQVNDTLNQLGHHNHYLRFKPIADWNEYDYNNYIVLSGKAGKVYTVYGIYDVTVEMEDAKNATSQPKRFFETYDKASLAIHEGDFDNQDVHILPVLVGDA